MALSANYDKRINSIYSIETHAYGARKDILCKKVDIKCNNVTKRYKHD